MNKEGMYFLINKTENIHYNLYIGEFVLQGKSHVTVYSMTIPRMVKLSITEDMLVKCFLYMIFLAEHSHFCHD
jgi:hypothetical protein